MNYAAKSLSAKRQKPSASPPRDIVSWSVGFKHPRGREVYWVHVNTADDMRASQLAGVYAKKFFPVGAVEYGLIAVRGGDTFYTRGEPFQVDGTGSIVGLPFELKLKLN